MSFAIGQRWISETENSLGLGMISALDFRSVTLHFPATDETPNLCGGTSAINPNCIE